MKKQRLNTCRMLLTGLWLVVAMVVNAQFTESREFTRRFRIQPETRIDITNKYGRIELNTWKKDSVVIRFRMEISERKPDKLKKTLNNLDFDISNTQHYLVIKTRVDKYQSQIGSELQKFKETMLSPGGSIRIDLTVWLPENRELQLDNKFGDILMGDYQGAVRVTLSNGKLRAGDLLNRSTLQLSFADATISSLTGGSIVSNYSDITLRSAGNLRLESKSSTIEIQRAGNLMINSRRDKYRIRMSEELDSRSNFSHFMVNELRDKAHMQMSYGSLDMENIQAAFQTIYIESKSTDVNLVFSPQAMFNYEITETKTDLNLGREMKEEDREVLDSKENKVRHSGYFGRKMKEDQVIINAVGGEVNVISN